MVVSDLQICIAGLFALVGLLLLRVPVAVALGLVSFAGLWKVVGIKSAFSMLTTIPHEVIANWTLTSVPMFLLMGFICYYAKLTEGLFEVARLWLSRLPGGLAIASIGAGASFSAVTGSSIACAAAIGRIAVPEMVRRGYDKSLAAGVCAASGTIGSMIPPSILLLIYGIFAEAPIGPLFLAGFLPGILTAINYALAVLLVARLRPGAAPPVEFGVTWRQRVAALRHTSPTLLLVIGVFGGLFSGMFTPTEAGAVGALMALVIALAMGTMNWDRFKLAVVETLQSTTAIFIIAIGANLLTRFLALGGFTDWLAYTIAGDGLSPLMLVAIVCGVYLVLGMFLDPLGIMLLTLPIFLPLMEAADVNLIWFGILIAKLLEMGLLTPPVGLNVFVIKGIIGDMIRTEAIFRGILWFLIADCVTLLLLVFFPDIALLLPNLIQ
jgi:tripartite ATP-independent transporter DctM subunit